MNAVIFIIQAILVVVSLLMVLVVLMQRPKQEGLGASFGAGVTDQIWGSQTTNVLQKFTVRLAIFFFGLALTLCILKAKQARELISIANALPTEKIEKKEVPPPMPPVANSTPIVVEPGKDATATIPVTPSTPTADPAAPVVPAAAEKPADAPTVPVTPTVPATPAPAPAPAAETPAPATPAAPAPPAETPAPATPTTPTPPAAPVDGPK
jgi:preprotein translocase subunit SecG